MALSLHPEAAAAFDNQAEEILTHLAPAHPTPTPPTTRFRPQFHRSKVLTREMVGSMRGSAVMLGDRLGRWFEHEGKRVDLDSEGSRLLAEVCANMQRTKALHNVVSLDTLDNVMLDWLKARYSGDTTAAMTGYVLPACADKIHEWEVWIPIAFTCIESETRIGRVTFRPVTQDLFEGFRRTMTATKGVEGAQSAPEWLDRWQTRIQGLAAATMVVTADPTRAYEIAADETDKSLSVLRFFSPANLAPGLTSYCAPLGRECDEAAHYLVLKRWTHLHTHEGAIEPSPDYWMLDNHTLGEFRRLGLGAMSELLLLEKGSEFQEALVDRLVLYSRNALAKSLSDKLVYVFAALEGFLLVNTTEPVQQTIADRIAFSIGQNVEERLAIVENVRNVYNLRSRYIHHGRSAESDGDVKAFLQKVWRFFLFLVHNACAFSTRTEFAEAIEKRKYS